MNRTVKCLLILFFCQLSPGSAAAGQGEDLLVAMFDWWNHAIRDPEGFTASAFRRYYTEDAAIVINGEERVRGIEAMVKHFRDIQQRVESVEIVLPFEEGFESGNRVFTYHLIRARENGMDRLSHVMGYAVIEDGKIALANFLSYSPSRDEAASTAPAR